jgi:peroxiredoxin Q/BCP
VASAFGVARPMVGVAKRTTWLIDPDGALRKVYPAVKPKGHAATVLEDCREIWG